MKQYTFNILNLGKPSNRFSLSTYEFKSSVKFEFMYQSVYIPPINGSCKY